MLSRVGIGELVILSSPYRSLSQPIRQYIKSLLAQHPDGFIQVLMGQLRTGSPMTQLLHQNSHFIEQLALQDLDRVVVTVVPIQLSALEEEEDDGEADEAALELAEPAVRL